MKRTIALLLSIVFMFSLASCKGKKKEEQIPLSEYTITYREEMGSYVEKFTKDKYAALRLQELLEDRYGIKLTVQNDSEEQAKREIIIGDARSQKNTVSPNGYTVKSSGDNIHICAGDIYSYTRAFEDMLKNTVFPNPSVAKKIDITGKVKPGAQSEESFVYVDINEMKISEKELPVKKLTIDGVDVSKYKIVYHDWEMKTYGLNEVYAAEQLQKYLKLATGVELPLVTDDTAATKYEIVVGITAREGDVISKIDRSSYGEEALLIKSEGTRLILTGAQRRGTIYAVYSFLEEYIGYRFFAEDCEVVYKADSIDIAKDTYNEQKPYLEYRDTNQYQALNHEYAAKRKINSNFRRSLSYKLGGTFNFSGEFVHTMATTFDLCEGDTQPCFSDEEIYQKTLEKLLFLCKNAPDTKIISVTQNDNYNYCSCSKCSRANIAEGSNGGALIRFINRLAEAIEEDYPDIKILTLAYMFSTVPTKTAPRDNVVIMYCPIESCCACALNDPKCGTNDNFMMELESWCELTDNVYVWYYVVEFIQDGQLAFMNFDALYENYEYLRTVGVNGMFNEGWMNDAGSEFGALRSYILSLLMWDQELTKEEYNKAIDEFIDAYYGEASDYVREYFAALEVCSNSKHFAQYTAANGIFRTEYFEVIENDLNSWWDDINGITLSQPVVSEHIINLYKGYNYLKDSL